MKIYCKNCKYHTHKRVRGQNYRVHKCKKIVEVRPSESYNDPVIGMIKAGQFSEPVGVELGALNKDYNCKFYKKKWYKKI